MRDFGTQQEILVLRYLVQNQYRIIYHSYISKYGEIDIIAEKNHTIIFFEVKSRKTRKAALSSISYKKKIRCYKTMLSFFAEYIEFTRFDKRFDAIFVINNHIEHIKSIFYFESMEENMA